MAKGRDAEQERLRYEACFGPAVRVLKVKRRKGE
eukprot:gene3713-900_t